MNSINIVDKILSGDIKDVCIDSRIVKDGSLFVPIDGENINGNGFVKDAILNGAKYSLINRKYYEDNYNEFKDMDLIIVDDTKQTLLDLTKEYLEKTGVKTIAITGSNGKTSTKDLLYSVLKTSMSVWATQGNYNNEIGLPLTVLNAPNDIDYMILEMGTSNKGEIDLLASCVRPNMAIITNIGTSHIERFGSREGIYYEKTDVAKYFDESSSLVVNSQDDLLNTISDKKFKVIKSSFLDFDSYFMRGDGFYSFCCDGVNIDLKVRGIHQLNNAALVIKLAKLLNISIDNIKMGIENYTGANMRFVTVDKGSIRIVNDAYNASRASIKAALATILNMEANRRIVVIGDVLELGDNAKDEHKKIGKLEEMKQLDMIFTIGEFSKEISYYNSNALHFNDLHKLIKYLNTVLAPHDLLLVKASRGMKLERIVESIEVKND